MPEPDLTERQLGILQKILTPYADKIERVGLFGSRATGKARPNSDIDIVLYGSIVETDIDRLRSLFDSSALEVKVDICAHHLVTYIPFREHIDRVMIPLFLQKNLTEKPD